MQEPSIENLLDPSKLHIDSPDWDKLEDSHELTLVHMQEKEVEPLVALNGEPDMKEEEGLGTVYSFPKLATLFDNPEIKRLFIDSVHHHRGHDPKKHDLLNDLHDDGLAHMPSLSSHVPGESQEQEELAHEGEYGDDMIVEIPLNVVKTFVEIEGRNPNINPHTGLLAFGKGWRNDIIRGLTTVLGAVYGGASGAGIGHLAGRVATGQSVGKALMPAAKMGLYTYGAQSILPHIPGISKGVESLSKYYPTLGEGLGALTGTGKALTSSGPMGAFGKIAGGINGAVSGGAKSVNSLLTGNEGKVPNGEVKNTEEGEKAGDYKGILGSPLRDLALVGGLNYMGSIRHQKFLEKQKREAEERYEKERARSGIDKPLVIPDYDKRVRNPEWDIGNGKPYYISESNVGGYAAGGRIEEGKMVKKKIDFTINGPGKGQDDLIMTKLEPDGYIIPADVTAMFGDGATDAGQQTLKDFVDHYTGKISSPKGKGSSKSLKKVHSVVARVANGETEIPEVFVTDVVGKGSNDRGAYLFDRMVENIRAHKRSNGLKLPPKALHPMEYMTGK